jgi:3-hydroxyisobutyrate dehydrogenase-like beta-hydroxyacid dehydrogenase
VPALEARRPGYLEGRYAPQFALRDLRKDLDFALALFGKAGSLTPLTRSSRELVTAAAAATPDDDISAVVRPYRLAERPQRSEAGAPARIAAVGP